MRPGLLDDALRATVWLSSRAPVVSPVRLTVCGGLFSFKWRSAIASMVGGSFTGRMVNRNDWLTVDAPSETETVIGVAPDTFEAGMMTRVSFVPSPLNAPLAMSAGFPARAIMDR